MNVRKYVATAVLAIAAVSVSAGTAYADPAQAPGASNQSVQTDILPGIHYTSSLVDGSVVVKTDGGSLTTANNQFQVLDGHGKLVAGSPLTYMKDGKDWPIAAKIDGNTATLTPSTNPADAVPTKQVAMLHNVAADNENFNNALSNFSSEVGLGVAIGSLIGTAIGAGIGCLAGGAILGGTATAATVGTLTIPGAIGGCIVTGAAAAAIGAVAGTIVVGGPVAIAAGIQFYNDTH